MELLKYKCVQTELQEEVLFVSSRVSQRESNVGTYNGKSGQQRFSLIALCVINEGLPRVYQVNMNSNQVSFFKGQVKDFRNGNQLLRDKLMLCDF